MAGADNVINRTLPALVGVYVVSRTADRVLDRGGKQRPAAHAGRVAPATYQVSKANQASSKKAKAGNVTKTSKGRVYLIASRRKSSPAKAKSRVTVKKVATKQRKSNDLYVIDKVPPIL